LEERDKAALSSGVQRTSPSPRNQFWRPSWKKEIRQPCPQGCREPLLLLETSSGGHLGGKGVDSPVLRGAESLLLLETSSGGHLGRKREGSPVLCGAESLLLLETGSGGHFFTFRMLRKA
jgi:hypothetical protein